MASLLVLDGSPRGARSNSMKMLSRVAEGWVEAGGGPVRVLHLAVRADRERALAAFAEHPVVLLGMPLYTDAMPGLVMGFIEALAPRVGQSNPRLGFLVQSGFPEALHSRPLQRYLEKLARRLDSPCAGTIVRGSGEALQMLPDRACGKLWAQLRTLGGQLARDGRFQPAELAAVAGTERFAAWAAPLLALASRLPAVNFYWDRQLRGNGVWARRFDAPYAS